MAQPKLLAQDSKPVSKCGRNDHLELELHNLPVQGSRLALKLVGVLLLVLDSTLVSQCVVVASPHLPDSTLVSQYVVVASLHLPGSTLVSKYVQNYHLLAESFTILHSILKKFTTSYKDKITNNM